MRLRQERHYTAGRLCLQIHAFPASFEALCGQEIKLMINICDVATSCHGLFIYKIYYIYTFSIIYNFIS